MGNGCHDRVGGPVSMDVLYYVMVGLFFVHELDAVKRHEWRIFPLIRSLPDTMGEQLFIWLHVPVFALLLLGGDGEEVNALRLCLSGFAILHVGLHWFYRSHPANEFGNVSSWALILGAGATGAAFITAAGVS
jgi:hypothetical protein